MMKNIFLTKKKTVEYFLTFSGNDDDDWQASVINENARHNFVLWFFEVFYISLDDIYKAKITSLFAPNALC